MEKFTQWSQCVDYTFKTRDSWRHGSGAKVARINCSHFTRLRGSAFPVVKLNNALMTQVSIELEDELKSNATINRVISAVSCALNHCAFDGLIDRPSQFRRRKESEGRREYFTKDEVDRLVAGAMNPYEREDLSSIIDFAAYSGLRQGEILRLKCKDIDINNGLIHVGGRPDVETKAKNYRTVPIHSRLYEMIWNRIDGTEPNVAIFGDEWLSSDQLLHAFTKVRNYVGLDPRKVFHSLRHSFGTWHASSGTSIRVIMEMMGHKNIETTLRYAKVMGSAQIAAMQNI